MTDGLMVLTGIVFAIFLLDWLAVGFLLRRAERFLKPLAMIMVIIWTLTAAAWAVDILLVLLILAQAFGLAGDVLLQFGDRWFLNGLGAFLLGHLFYITLLGWMITLNFRTFGFPPQVIWSLLLSLIVWSALLVVFYRIFRPTAPKPTFPRQMWVAIQVYGWTLSALVMLSILFILSTPTFSKLLLFLPLGSYLFFISDLLLGYDRFKRKLPTGRVWVMITYHLAQFSLAWGFLSQMGYIGK